MTTSPIDAVSPYADLTLYDAAPSDLFDTAMTEASLRFPGWEPRAGDTEVVLLEVMALQVAELVFAINRVPGAVIETLLSLYGVVRDPGSAPTADVQLFASNTLGLTIPAGVRVRLPADGTDEPMALVTTSEGLIPPGQSSVVVPALGVRVGSDGAGTEAGTELTVTDAVAGLERAQLASALAGGRDTEDTARFFDRGVARLSRLVTTLVLPRHFTAAALEEPYVMQAATIDNYDPREPTGPGTNPGHVTVAAAGVNGTPLIAADKAALLAKLVSQALGSLRIHLADPTVTPVNLTVSVVRTAEATDAQAEASVRSVLGAYLTPDAWAFQPVVYRNDLIALLTEAPYVQRVVNLTPAGDVTLPGTAPMPRLGTVTVTVSAS